MVYESVFLCFLKSHSVGAVLPGDQNPILDELLRTVLGPSAFSTK